MLLLESLFRSQQASYPLQTTMQQGPDVGFGLQRPAEEERRILMHGRAYF